jgi:hypothetical protein
LHDIRFAAPLRDPAGGKPVSVQEIGVDTPRRADEAGEQCRDEQREPRSPP